MRGMCYVFHTMSLLARQHVASSKACSPLCGHSYAAFVGAFVRPFFEAACRFCVYIGSMGRLWGDLVDPGTGGSWGVLGDLGGSWGTRGDPGGGMAVLGGPWGDLGTPLGCGPIL